MLTLYFSPGACSMAAHIALEESGEEYQAQRVNFADAEQRSEGYLKLNPQGRVPTLLLDDGEPIAENTAILPYLGKRFGLWPTDPTAEVRVLSFIGFLATSVHPSVAHMWRPERYASDPSVHPAIKDMGQKTFDSYLRQIDAKLSGRQWFLNEYSVVDPYLFVFYVWGGRRGYPMQELKNFTALKDKLLQRQAVQQVLSKEGIKL
jgi:glutathione S-transferase